jgi:hypothetical protein
MANDKDIKIGIQTTADTSGIRATEDALEDLQKKAEETGEESGRSIFGEVDPAQQQQMMEDLEAVQKKHAEVGDAAQRAGKAQKDSMQDFVKSATVAGTAVGAVFGTLKTVFGQVQAQYDQLAAADPEFAAKTEAMGVAIRTLADPVEGLRIAWRTASSAIVESLDDIALGGSLASVQSAVAAQQMAQQMAAAFAKAKADHAEMARSMRADSVAQLLSIQEQEARLFVESLQNAQRIRDAQASASAATAGTDAQRVFVELQNQFDQQTTSNQIAEFAVAEANRKLSEALALRTTAPETEQAAVAQAIILAEANLASAEAAYSTALAETAIRFGESVRASMVGVNENYQDNLDRTAAQVLADLQAKAAEVGGNLSSSAREAIAGLEKILEDGVVKPEEMMRLTEAMARIHASREGADAEILAGLNNLATATQAVLTELPAINARITGLMSQIETLQSQ